MAPKKGADGLALAAVGDNAKPEKIKSEKRSRKAYADRDSSSKKGSNSKSKQQDKSSSSKDTAMTPTAESSANNINPATANNPNDGNVNLPSNNKKAKQRTTTTPVLHSGGRSPRNPNPLLLARGMSSRYLSSRVSHRLAPLSKDAVERDLRHVDAYRIACNGYDQQVFVYRNQELVRSGYFGAFAPFPTVGGDVVRPVMPPSRGVAITVPASSKSRRLPFSMPIKIDPDEEKRLSLLRKKIHRSEFEREGLETEYNSLRAHFVHEIQLARRTRTYELGRWELLRECMDRRARVLGLMRARMAIGRDVELLMKFCGEWTKSGVAAESVAVADGGAEGAITAATNASGAVSVADKNGAAAAVGGIASITGATKEAKGNEEMKRSAVSLQKKAAATSTSSNDLIEIWNSINSQLKEAETACVDLKTPKALLQMIASFERTNSSASGSSTRSRSPARSGGEKVCSGRKRSGSATSADETANTNNAMTATNASSGNNRKGKSPIPSGLEPHVIPWDCAVEPRTPYGVPLLLSCLSLATDRAVGFVTDKTNPGAITWIESTLPESTASYEANTKDLTRLREEAHVLEEELKRENERNTELQKSIIASRSRSDEMVTMMQLLRSETEAVLERHNLIMETPEARAKSVELHKKLLEEEKLKNPSAAGEEAADMDEEEEEGEVLDEMTNEDLSSGEEEEIRDDIDDEEEDVSEDDDDESVTIKEITVDKDSNNAAGESDDEEDEVGSEDEEEEEEGEIAEEDEEEDEEEDRDGEEEEENDPNARTRPTSCKRSGHHVGDGDEDSSSLTPPNGGSHRKRRRY